MIKFIRVALSFLLIVNMTLFFSSCTSKPSQTLAYSDSEQVDVRSIIDSHVSNTNPKNQIRIGALNDMNSTGALDLIEKNSLQKSINQYKFFILSSSDDISNKVINSELDIAIVPTNLAASLYQKTHAKYQIVAITNTGYSHILQNGDSIKNISDLKGKTIMSVGKDSAYEYVIRYLLNKNGLQVGTDVFMDYRSTYDEIYATLQEKDSIAMLSEPFSSIALSKNPDISVSIDISKEWNKSSFLSSKILPMGAIIVNTEFLKNNKSDFETFLKEYENSTNRANSDLDYTEKLAKKYNIENGNVLKDSISSANLTFISGKKLKKPTASFLESVYRIDPNAVGGSLPSDNFYFLNSKN